MVINSTDLKTGTSVIVVVKLLKRDHRRISLAERRRRQKVRLEDDVTPTVTWTHRGTAGTVDEVKLKERRGRERHPRQGRRGQELTGVML